MSEGDLERPVPGSEEEWRDAAEDRESAEEEEAASLPFDANEADAADQHREVRLDEDDYR